MTASKIAMLGLGSMNGAILSGLLSSGVQRTDVLATTRSVDSAAKKATQYGVKVVAEETRPGASKEAVVDADIVFLGVKPHQITAFCEEIAPALKPDAVVVSVAAAITVDMMEGSLRPGQPVIRSMPNTPLSVGQGVVGLVPGTHATPRQAQQIKELLEACGAVHVIEESQIDALTGISGSGPAYAFYLAEHMAAAGVELGLDPALAADLAAHTVFGAGKMLVKNQESASDDAVRAGVAAQLREAVCSPNGTTERAISAFDEHGLPAGIAAGVKASASRASEITAELKAQQT